MYRAPHIQDNATGENPSEYGTIHHSQILRCSMFLVPCSVFTTPYLAGIEDLLHENHPEENRFFYHPDHLGSSSFITDADGEGYQHLQYLPFGETFVSQKISWWSTPYQFTGKEKDDETGYNYFGARYYNSDISVWLSVDPMARKAPMWSPYRYGFQNPNKFIDPDGKFETRKEAKQAKRDHNLPGIVRKIADGSYIISSRRTHTVYRRALPDEPQQVSTRTLPSGIMAIPRISAGVSTVDRVVKFFSDGVWTIGITGTAAASFLGGSIELGATLDFRKGFKIGGYLTLEHAVGVDLSGGLILNYHKPVANPDNFSVSDLNKWGETYNGAIWIIDGTYGGNSFNKGLDPNNYSDTHTTFNTYGGGISTGLPFGVTKNKGYTWTMPIIHF